MPDSSFVLSGILNIQLFYKKFNVEGTEMMKKLLVMLGLGVMLTFTACGSDEKAQESTAVVSDVENDSAEADVEESVEETEIVFEEQVVVDNEDCLIKITGITEDEIWGYTLNVYLENRSTEKNYMFTVESAAINGVQCDPYFASEIAAGKKVNDEIIFNEVGSEEAGVGDYTDLELTFRVYDSDDWLADDVVNETIHVYPYGEENAVAFVRESKDTDNVVVDNENVTVIVTGYTEDEIWGYQVNLFLVNKTDKLLMFSTDNASVNGFMADPFYACSVIPGKSAYSTISFSNEDLEANSIAAVETIEMNLRVYNYDDWSEDDLVNEVITLNP